MLIKYGLHWEDGGLRIRGFDRPFKGHSLRSVHGSLQAPVLRGI